MASRFGRSLLLSSSFRRPSLFNHHRRLIQTSVTKSSPWDFWYPIGGLPYPFMSLDRPSPLFMDEFTKSLLDKKEASEPAIPEGFIATSLPEEWTQHIEQQVKIFGKANKENLAKFFQRIDYLVTLDASCSPEGHCGVAVIVLRKEKKKLLHEVILMEIVLPNSLTTNVSAEMRPISSILSTFKDGSRVCLMTDQLSLVRHFESAESKTKNADILKIEEEFKRMGKSEIHFVKSHVDKELGLHRMTHHLSGAVRLRQMKVENWADGFQKFAQLGVEDTLSYSSSRSISIKGKTSDENKKKQKKKPKKN